MLLSFHFFFRSRFSSHLVSFVALRVVLDLRLKPPGVKKKSPAFFFCFFLKKNRDFETQNHERGRNITTFYSSSSLAIPRRRLSRKQRAAREREFLREKRRLSFFSCFSRFARKRRRDHRLVENSSFRERSLKF